MSTTQTYFALQHRISAVERPEELAAIWEDAKRTLPADDPNLGGIAEAISRVRREMAAAAEAAAERTL